MGVGDNQVLFEFQKSFYMLEKSDVSSLLMLITSSLTLHLGAEIRLLGLAREVEQNREPICSADLPQTKELDSGSFSALHLGQCS